MGNLVVSIDVEDWPQSTWDRELEISPRAEANTFRVLELLAARGRSATFFVLGKYADKFPESVRRIASEGHEVASHGYGHIEVFNQTREEFRADVSRSKDLLEDIIGGPVRGYRAPDFSITENSLWALDVLAESGFEYDSSIVPKRMSRYGIEWWPPDPVSVRLPGGRSIVELPIATVDVGSRRIPIGGGGYHRLFPWRLIEWAIRERLRKHELFMAYCHPYEFDAAEFSEINLPVSLKTRLHQGLGRRGFRAKFERMLQKFPTITANEAADLEWARFDPSIRVADETALTA